MRLVDFFRLSVKVDRPMVTLDDEMELLEAYMELFCCRYPELQCEYDIDPDLGGAQAPNFTLQPIVENSLLHGLKNKGYRGRMTISAQKVGNHRMEIAVRDTGSGFVPGKKAEINALLANYTKQPPKLTGNSIGILNVLKRIKLLCGAVFAGRGAQSDPRPLSSTFFDPSVHLAVWHIAEAARAAQRPHSPDTPLHVAGCVRGRPVVGCGS